MAFFGSATRHHSHRLGKAPPGLRGGHSVKSSWQNVFHDNKARSNLFGKQKGKARIKK